MKTLTPSMCVLFATLFWYCLNGGADSDIITHSLALLGIIVGLLLMPWREWERHA